MKWVSLISKAILLAGLAGLGLVPLQAQYPQALPQPAGTAPLLKVARGSRITQLYVQPTPDRTVKLPTEGPVSLTQVQSVCEKQIPLGEAGFRLRPRSTTRLRATVLAPSPGYTAIGTRPASNEKLAVFDFDVFYGEFPVVNSSRTVLVSDGQTLAIRDRNPPRSLIKPVMPPQTTHPNSAWSLALNDSTAAWSKLYPGKSPYLTADPKDPSARLVLWPDEKTRQLHLSWAVTVRSSSRPQPFLRRYWVSAAPPVRVLDFEDLIFYQPQPAAAMKPSSPSAGILGSTPKRANGSRPKVTITDWPTPSRSDLDQANFAAPPKQTAVRSAAAPMDSSHTAIFNGSVTGTVIGSIWESSPYGPVISRPMPGVEIRAIRPTGYSSATYSDTAGRYNLAGVSGLATVTATLNGRACRIINDASSSAATFRTRVGQGTVEVDFAAAANDEFKLAQNSAFFAVTQAFDFLRGYVPDYPVKLAPMVTHVNVDSSCNAYYDRSDNTLNFFRSSTGTVQEKGCPNTGYRDVVFHEYGHAVDEELGGILDGAYSEGFGDCLSILITHSPLVGTDFYGPGKHLRDARKIYLWPKVKDSEIHESGQAYSGFCWELTQQLQRVYGSDRAFEVAKQLLLGAAAQNPRDIPDAVRLSFYLDSRLYPGSRAGESQHIHQLRAAAQSRQLPIPKDASNLSSP